MCQLLLRPSQNPASSALPKCHKMYLGGQPAGQVLGTRLKELRLVFLSPELGDGGTCSSE